MKIGPVHPETIGLQETFKKKKIMEGICMNFLDPDLFSYSLSDIAIATDFWQNLQKDLYSTRWHFATDLNIAIPIYRC